METEIVTIKLHKQTLYNLIDCGALGSGEYELKIVDVPNVDYSSNELWKAQKSVSDKAYKKLKEIEFNIRNK